MDPQVIGKTLEFMADIYDSPIINFIKVFLMVYTLVLFVDFVLLLVFKGIRSDMRKNLTGTEMPFITKGKMEKKWEGVMRRLQSGNVSQYKVAILEADSIVDEILGRIGHGGENMAERLEQMKTGQLDYQDELIAAHKVRNRIIHDESFLVDEDLAKKTVAIYERFLRYMEFL